MQLTYQNLLWLRDCTHQNSSFTKASFSASFTWRIVLNAFLTSWRSSLFISDAHLVRSNFSKQTLLMGSSNASMTCLNSSDLPVPFAWFANKEVDAFSRQMQAGSALKALYMQASTTIIVWSCTRVMPAECPPNVDNVGSWHVRWECREAFEDSSLSSCWAHRWRGN